MLTPTQVSSFHEDGFVIVPDLLDARETELLGTIARRDQALASQRTSRTDGEGGAVDLVVQNDLPEDSVYGAVSYTHLTLPTKA